MKGDSLEVSNDIPIVKTPFKVWFIVAINTDAFHSKHLKRKLILNIPNKDMGLTTSLYVTPTTPRRSINYDPCR